MLTCPLFFTTGYTAIFNRLEINYFHSIKKNGLQMYSINPQKEHNVEKYVEQNVPKNQRSLCAQLCALPLALETGRFSGLKQRLCLLCNLGEIENEIHCMFYCPLYDALRDVVFSKMSLLFDCFFHLDEYEKFELRFGEGTFHTANHICKAWEMRKNTFYL